MGDNYNKFISACNEINTYLVEKYNLDKMTTFGKALVLTRNKDRIVDHYWNQLEVYMDLRNILIHGQHGDSIIANPSDEVLKNIVDIKQKLLNPSVVGHLFKCDVISFYDSSLLEDLLYAVRANDYTQFPIFDDNGLKGLISENAITRWLSRKIKDDIISIKETTISEVLPLEESKNNYKIIEPNRTVYDVLSIFEKGYKNNNKSLVLLISNTLKPRKFIDIQGIITYADLQKINSKL